MRLTGYQVKQINDFMGGDYEGDVTIENLPERAGSGGEAMPAGLHIWCSDYPEEGAVLLDPVDRDTIGDSGDYPALKQA